MQVVFDRILCSRVNNASTHKEVRELLKPKHIVTGLLAEQVRYNRRVDIANREVDKRNTDTFAKWERGDITSAVAMEQWVSKFRITFKDAGRTQKGRSMLSSILRSRYAQPAPAQKVNGYST